MSIFNDATLRHRLNHLAPATREAALGDVIYDLIAAVNGLAARLDAARSPAVVAATATATVGGAVAAGNVTTLTFTNAGEAAFPATVSYTALAGDTVNSVAAGLAAAVAANAVLAAASLSASATGAVITVSHNGTIGNGTIITKTVAGAVTVTISGQLAGGVFGLGTANAATFGVALPSAR